MNNESRPMLNVTFTGTLSISQDQLEQLLGRLPASVPPAPEAPTAKRPSDDGRPQRLAYTTKETAEILGVSCGTVHRLIRRGLQRSSSALRCKIISKAEIE